MCIIFGGLQNSEKLWNMRSGTKIGCVFNSSVGLNLNNRSENKQHWFIILLAIHFIVFFLIVKQLL